MRTLCFVMLINSFISCTGNKTGTTETGNSSSNDSVFGKKIDDKGAITMAELTEKMQGKSELRDVKVTAKITEVCQEMGCWMNVEKEDGSVMFVKMKDHEFFLPKDTAGKTVIMSGVAMMNTTSVEDLRHIAEDAKKSKEEIEKITEPKFELTFDADGVIIR